MDFTPLSAKLQEKTIDSNYGLTKNALAKAKTSFIINFFLSSSSTF
ncbi:hypothetical protein HMPREF0548_1922 [Lactobacillus ultunensis DSM 16047]|uniref:Uncharacterized protein n=1 Tax=Lactobacillus ultunensis DSM 16047 TaxID=525365 RepID=C2EQH6_9LACO|nr:hypothetical protein HMPREF0548_1922 [Lactobacillus ultunensis DSM 16047]